jgi:hypothetical protein
MAKNTKTAGTKNVESNKHEQDFNKYQQMLRSAEKQGLTRVVSSDLMKFEEVGENLLGRLVAQTVKKSNKFDRDMVQYTFDTDEGRKKVFLGAIMDDILSEKDYIGSVMMIIFKGWIELDSGRRARDFKLIMVDEQVN